MGFNSAFKGLKKTYLLWVPLRFNEIKFGNLLTN